MSPHEVAKLLLDIKAVTLNLKKPYRYASGILSPIYCDNRILLGHPQHRNEILSCFLQKINSLKTDFACIAGVATAGIPHAALIAHELKKPMVYVRPEKKGHGKQNQIEGGLKKGWTVLVVEDHISTGSSSLAAVQALRDAGARVGHMVAITTYQLPKAAQAFAQASCSLHTLTDFDSVIEAATKSAYITKQEAQKILEWKVDSQGWGKKMGFE